MSIPYLNLFAWKGDTGFTLWADNVRQTDQRYFGIAGTKFTISRAGSARGHRK